MIAIDTITLMRGAKVLLQEASARIFPGQKVALIGQNGCGKSSLFALLRQELGLDAGNLSLPSQWRIVSVAQETPAVDRGARDYVIDGDHHLRKLQAQLDAAQAAHDGEAIAHLHESLAIAGAYDIEARASSILAGLGFSDDQLTRPVTDFSGGWRMRLNLARALLCPSDLLLLDEPTNHLDLDAVIWLERWLQNYKGTLILISHDKAFIDSTVSQILSVESQQLYSYTGNYSSYEEQRAERLRQQDIEFQKQQDKIAHLNSFITRFKAKASKAKQAQSRIKQLERMELLLPAHQQSSFSFSFAPPPKLPNPLIQLDQVAVGYGDTPILTEVKLNLVPGSRIGLLGRNGQGKSTLIKMLAGTLPPLRGHYAPSQGLQIGYFAQHQLDTLDANATPLLHLQRLDKQATEQRLRDFLGGFGFHGDQAVSLVAPMSGGEKARLVLALLVYQKPNLLLLDEPTNHLDLEMRHALSFALQSFEGAMVVVSHDRFLLSSVCEDFYLVDQQKVKAFDGDLDDYKKWILQQPIATNEDGTTSGASPKVDKKDIKRLEAELRQKMAPFKKQRDKAEQTIAELQTKLTALATQLANPDVYEASQKAQLLSLLAQQQQYQSAVEDAEMLWMEAEEAMEAIRRA